MRKISFLILLFVGCMVYAHAQIGINTNYPKGILHIDAAGDNPQNATTPPNAAQEINDVIVDTNGNMGIGTLSPNAKLHVVAATGTSGFTLKDGTEGANKVLTCQDATGKASWQLGTQVFQVQGTDPSGIKLDTWNDVKYSNRSITMSKGTWIIRYNLTWRISGPPPGALYIDVFLSTSPTINNTVPGSWSIRPVPANQSYSSSQMTLVYEVTAASQTLYLWAYYNGTNISTSGMYIEAYNPAPQSNILEAIKW